MSRKHGRKPLERVPSARRPTAKTPKPRGAATVPAGNPRRPPPPQHVSQAPPERPAGKPPNPKKPRLVRDVRGGALKDLFEIFGDLPRPPRPERRVFSPSIGRRRR